MENQFTRKALRDFAKECGVEMPKEFEDGLIDRHISSRDAYAEKQVTAAKGETVNVKESDEYKALEQQLNGYKAKATKTAKETAYKAVLKAAGIPEKRFDAICRVMDFDTVELDEKGGIKDADALTKAVKTDWADFIPTTTEKGVDTKTPPANNQGPAEPKTLAEALHQKYD